MKDLLEWWQDHDTDLQKEAECDAEKQFFVGEYANLQQTAVTSHIEYVKKL